MKKHNSNKQITTKGDQKEMFAFYIGIDLGDKTSVSSDLLRVVDAESIARHPAWQHGLGR